ncbi:CO/xanthine dehydrogenase Mo-binding subunit [Aestuariispira insulae]|uniref:CO/xanthine dehydrogenase Mo-binding subunit n=2 Tax=Aestuariispira insulae TaxID=1461337 RepID=A0A3D9HPJ5_9PROT|nr:CO/xanthine dehydrogenase Mo-binding subunit [Aestuariispira insulae]
MLKTAGGAVALNLLPFPFKALEASITPAPAHWAKGPGEARFRIDGLDKVLGRKVYARDYHATDMPGWPQAERPVMIIRAVHADRPFNGLDLSGLPPELQPETIVTGQQILQDGIILPYGINYDYVVVAGNVPDYLGQPVAFLIFKDRKSYRRAKKRLQFNNAIQQYGAQTSPSPPVEYTPLTDYVRKASPTGGKDLFSYTLNGGDKDYTKEARTVENAINAEIANKTASGEWVQFQADFSMQAMDPMFMEPEAGIAWYDRNKASLSLVLGTQSPDGDISSALDIFSSDNSHNPIKTVNLTSCYPGGGFGGRDKSIFTLYLAIAAVYANGPVRIAQDRFEQFQAGLKRHACDISQSLVFDKKGQMQALNARMDFDGGGRKNLSPYVAQLAGLCVGGGYEIPQSVIKAEAHHSVNVTGGSQRGFGGPQAFFATETLMDEAAESLAIDAIELRRMNMLKRGMNTVVGGPILEELRLGEILDKAAHHPVWRDRDKERQKHTGDGQLYGVGFALSNQAYGTSGDGMLGYVSLGPDGSLQVTSNAVDMGNGSATTLAVVTATYLGRNADVITMGDAASFNQLQLQSGYDGANPGWDNPRWVKKVSGSSSACLTAFHQVHAIEQASLVLLETAILPAANALWKKDVDRRSIRWRNGALTSPGNRPLDLSEIARWIYDNDGYAGAMIHAYFQAEWVQAEYQIGNRPYRFAIDALGLFKAGSFSPILVNRQNGVYPSDESARYSRTTFAPCGNLIALTVDPSSGQVRILNSISILNAGRIITKDLVEGQSEGGIAMAIGYTLLEDMPPGLSGPAAGNWNLNRYHVPLASDVPIHDLNLETLLPLPGDRTAKGIAEAVMCSVAPAIANALADATGKRFRDLPITNAKILEALA